MPNRTRPKRSLLALIAILSVVATGSPAAAASPGQPVVLRAPDRTETSGVVATGGAAASSTTPSLVRPVTSAFAPEWLTDPATVADPADAAIAAETASAGADWIRRPSPNTPEPKAKVQAKGDGAAADLKGRNHVWIPALGVDRSVSFFSCSSNAYPGDRVYRWGCAGGNNVYLFGHAYSVFKPLHDAYVRGNLRNGMKVYYADARGRVSTYAVRWWKVTTPDRGEFAYASQSRPSLTLQTCVGAKSQYRLIVRLVKTG